MPDIEYVFIAVLELEVPPTLKYVDVAKIAVIRQLYVRTGT